MEKLRGDYSGAYTLRIEGDREAFEKKLEAKGCTITPNGKHLIDVILADKLDTDFILTTAKATRVQLRKLLPAVQPLEDVFVKLVKEDANADI